MHLLLLLALAQDDPIDLLKKVDATYKALSAYHIESDSVSTRIGEDMGSWQRSRRRLIVASPTKLRFEGSHPMASYDVVADGTNLWRASTGARQFVKTTVSGPIVQTRGGGMDAMNAIGQLRNAMLLFTPNLERIRKAEFLPDEWLTELGKPYLCRVVRATYEPYPFQTSWERTFYVDTSRNLVLREVGRAQGTGTALRPYDESSSISTHTVTHHSITGPFDDSQFVYFPPGNYTEVDRMETVRMSSRTTEMIGKPLGDFRGIDLDGKPASLAPHAGKPILIDFWATWCGPCREQMPELSKLRDKIEPQGVVVLGISSDESRLTALEYVKKHGYNWQHWMEEKPDALRSRFHVDGIPTLMLVDREGKIVEVAIGSGSESDTKIRTALRKLGINPD